MGTRFRFFGAVDRLVDHVDGVVGEVRLNWPLLELESGYELRKCCTSELTCFLYSRAGASNNALNLVRQTVVVGDRDRGMERNLRCGDVSLG